MVLDRLNFRVVNICYENNDRQTHEEQSKEVAKNLQMKVVSDLIKELLVRWS